MGGAGDDRVEVGDNNSRVTAIDALLRVDGDFHLHEHSRTIRYSNLSQTLQGIVDASPIVYQHVTDADGNPLYFDEAGDHVTTDTGTPVGRELPLVYVKDGTDEVWINTARFGDDGRILELNWQMRDEGDVDTYNPDGEYVDVELGGLMCVRYVHMEEN